MARRSVAIACVRVPGFHVWREAPGDVAFLGSTHRHLFTVRVEWLVGHADRDVEFFRGQDWIRAALDRAFPPSPGPLNAHGIDFGGHSCEHIASEIMEAITASGRPAPVACEVWEDDENGARVQEV